MQLNFGEELEEVKWEYENGLEGRTKSQGVNHQTKKKAVKSSFI